MTPQPTTTVLRRRGHDLLELLGALVLGTAVAMVGLRIISAVSWPAYNTSNVTRALTTLGQAVVVVLAVIAAVTARYRPSWRLSTSWLGSLASAGLVTVSLGMPLAATKLYLHGLTADQQFRTEYLTRLTSSPRLHDMTYVDLPPYYPATWFWFGGRYADLFGLPGWEAYKPWSIISIAAAAALGAALWNRMVGVTVGTAVGLAVTAATLYFASPEPYAAVLILVGVPMLVVIASALRGRGRSLADGPGCPRESNWLAVAAAGVFLGVSATVYTLYTALFAGTAVLIALVYLVQIALTERNSALAERMQTQRRRVRMLGVVLRLLVMGVLAGAVALLFWGPYLIKRATSPVSGSGAAEHYLPEGGAVLPLPVFQLSLIGVLTLAGLVWTVWRMRQRTIAFAFAAALVGILVLTLASLARTAIGSTLLSFRLEAPAAGILAAAGVFAAVALSRAAVAQFGDIRTVIGVLAAVGAIGVAQQLPATLSSEITIAYTDTDGYGERGDQRPAGSEAYYRQLHRLIGEQTGKPATQNIVLTADYSFLSIYPYWGFQGLTSHYANPLAQFEARAETIERWAQSTDTAEFQAALAQSPWPVPNVFVFRYSPDGYTLRLAKDVYPNDPNIKRYTVTFDPAVFDDPAFTVTEVGPFVLVVRSGG
ncbi:arabinosyltransferase AftA [Gordonia hirsuta DSM 44140 = NBRC 16056]|uniref:Galactan 5-O-arabinofuranosyltransferase n=1 Tax=Gordonia hirsuta DSM 44140 = NBRC 16056 TaxID=1121927 RepID=L7LCK7_9ACTN|nr:arabinofuranosyltransferase [Gordonia hirsuta]GAC58865.1 arabinosyltransferase AftA [Gordonia hirsuta DSM 44140 = NBRC 16056]